MCYFTENELGEHAELCHKVLAAWLERSRVKEIINILFNDKYTITVVSNVRGLC